MQITELAPTRFELPGRADPVYIATERWALEPWEGEDPPDLGHRSASCGFQRPAGSCR